MANIKDVNEEKGRPSPGKISRSPGKYKFYENYYAEEFDFKGWRKDSVHVMFKKFISLRNEDEGVELFKLPETGLFFWDPVWKIDTLMVLKDKLNEAKSELDDTLPVFWHKHTRRMNPANHILNMLRSQYNAEFCTQAWAKFMEIFSTHPIIPKYIVDINREGIEATVNSVHLCEAPGAFIAATNHYIKTHCQGLKWNWLATTFNPYHEANDVDQMINEDKLIQTTHERWNFLKDNTGNIINRENIKCFVRKIKDTFNHMHFVTADGSIDCQDNPEEQENHVLQLQCAEIVTALMILEKGGSFVLKIFTFFECATICHLYFLSCLFKEVKIIKPVMSKEGNSEAYVICLGYLGYIGFEAELRILLSQIGIRPNQKNGQTPRSLFPQSSIPEFFISRLIAAAQLLVPIQILTIRRNLETYGRRFYIYHILNETQEDLAKQWLEHCTLRKLKKNEHICETAILTKKGPSNVDGRDENKSLVERKEKSIITLKNLNVLEDKLEYYKMKYWVDRLMIEIQEEYTIGKVKLGKAYTNIYGSRWCQGKLLKIRNTLRELVLTNWDSLSISDSVQELHCSEEGNKERLNLLINKYQGKKAWTLINMCYHETSNILGTKTDAELTESGLKSLIARLVNLDYGDIVFLCEFPLLTRLHVSIIFMLTSCFEKVTLCFRETRNVLGVLLYGFKKLDAKLKETLLVIALSLEDARPNATLLEVIEMSVLCKSKHVQDLLTYNLINVTRSIDSNIKQLSKLDERRESKSQELDWICDWNS